MMQTIFMFLAPTQEAVAPAAQQSLVSSMATRSQVKPQPARKPAWRGQVVNSLAVLGNAAGFMVFLAGLWLVLRLAELLLS